VKQLTAHDFSLPAAVQSDLELLPGKSRDEVGELAASFIHMEQALQQSIQNLKETTAAKERIESELKIAHDIQMSILPKIFPPFPDRSEFDLYATIESAREVGGDFYDFSLIDDHHLWFAIGDVSGKGVPASLFMAATKILLRAIAGKGNRPDAILAELNEELCRDNDSGMFVTIFHGILHIPSGKLEYSNGGHNLPYFLSRNGTVEPLENTGGMALGVLKDTRYRAKTIQLRVGEGLFLYTDGVTEAMDSEDNLFSNRRLHEFLQRANGASPTELIRGVLGEVKRFASGAEQSDDITALAIHYLNDDNHDDRTMSKPMSILFKNKLSEVERLGQVVAEFAERYHLSPNLAFEINLALEEILTNVISYGYDDSDEHEIMIRLSCKGEEVTAEVEDDGRPFNPLEAAEPDTGKPLEERPVGGLGIHLVRKFMDDVEYKSQQGKNLLVMKKRIPST
jgi:sigma-B regulation protein RsbU (phosphoserine phosphatase)